MSQSLSVVRDGSARPHVVASRMIPPHGRHLRSSPTSAASGTRGAMAFSMREPKWIAGRAALLGASHNMHSTSFFLGLLFSHVLLAGSFVVDQRRRSGGVRPVITKQNTTADLRSDRFNLCRRVARPQAHLHHTPRSTPAQTTSSFVLSCSQGHTRKVFQPGRRALNKVGPACFSSAGPANFCRKVKVRSLKG